MESTSLILRFRNLIISTIPLIIIILSIISTDVIIGQSITTESGFWQDKYYQEGKKLDKNKVESLLIIDSEAHSLWSKAKKQQAVSNISFIAQTGFFIWQIAGNPIGKDCGNSEFGLSEALPYIGIFGTGMMGLLNALASKRNKKAALAIYNKGEGHCTSWRITPSITGLTVTFKF
ncbi:MAG: hypothetical protein V3V00_00555 [Saprospiraceae bacterium]